MHYKTCEICVIRSGRSDGQMRIFIAKFPLNEDSCSYAPISLPRFSQRSFFSSQVLWGRCTHKTRNFKKVTHCVFDMDGTIIGGERLCFYCDVDEAKGFSSCSHAPISPSRCNQKSFFSSQVQWGRSTHKTRNFKKVTHCVFDMDGTVIDSECQYQKILKELCAKHGKKYTRELESKNYGATDKQTCENVVKDLQLNMSAIDLEKELQIITKLKLPKAPLKRGIERLMKHLVRSGVLFALATNSSRRDVRLHVATKPKIFRMFHHMVCAGDPDVERGKPFPDLYLMAASKFPEKPAPVKCLVFEDSLIGLEAGLAAGMQVVMTPPKSLPMKDCAAATLVLESLLDFKPEYFGLPPFTDDVKNKPKVSKF